MFFLQILERNGHKRTQREGLCTGTAKSEPWYDIYLEQTAVYRYIVAALIDGKDKSWKTVIIHSKMFS